MNSGVYVKCPTCQRAVEWTDRSPYKPFCSERCKLIDLGDWATEAHKIPGEPQLPEFDADHMPYAD